VDADEHVDAEEHRVTLDAVGRLAGKVAHHLNNLLTAVEGNVSLLEAELAQWRATPELSDIRDACGRARELSNQLLSISGHRWREPRVVDLPTLVAGMGLGRFFSGDVGFCTWFAGVECPVRVDPVHIQEVVVELVLNAREAVDGCGTVLVEIDHLPVQNGGGSPGRGWVKLEVSDSGRGMDRETLSRVFQPCSGDRPFLEDRGLGLSVALGIVRQSGGTMRVSSAPGRGTTVRVMLPAVSPDEDLPGGWGGARPLPRDRRFPGPSAGPADR